MNRQVIAKTDNEIINPVSPESTVVPRDPEAIVISSDKSKNDKVTVSKSKKKEFFSPDHTMALEPKPQINISGGNDSTHTYTGKMLSILSGRLLYGKR